MSGTVCLAAKTLDYPDGGGHLWAYLNWALGIQSLGWEVVWLEAVDASVSGQEIASGIRALQDRLRPYGLADRIAVCSWSGEELPPGAAHDCLPIEAAFDAEALINMQHGTHPDVVKRFRRSILLDIDPGLLQLWMARGEVEVAPHDVYLTIGEPTHLLYALAQRTGLRWSHTPPCVALEWWPVAPRSADAPFTTVSHWSGQDGSQWVLDGDDVYCNEKRVAFEPLLDLPQRAQQTLELALCLGEWDAEDAVRLRSLGWRVRDAHAVAGTPWDYQRYLQTSAGEFSCAKPSYVRLQTAWVSDRTICYLASGKPVVVQHTGPSAFLPEAAGLFRFRDMDGAVQAFEALASDYDMHAQLARQLAEECFDARKVVGAVLERALA